MKILPAAFVVVGDTLQEAQDKRALLDSLVDYSSSIASLSIALGVDASKFDPDKPLPDIPDTNASKSARDRVISFARRSKMSVRQLAQRLGGYSGLGSSERLLRSQMKCRNGLFRKPPTASTSCSLTCLRASTTS